MVLLCQAGTMTHPVPALSAPRYREDTQPQHHQAGVHSCWWLQWARVCLVSSREPGHVESVPPPPCPSPVSEHPRVLPCCAFVVGLGYSSVTEHLSNL